MVPYSGRNEKTGGVNEGVAEVINRGTSERWWREITKEKHEKGDNRE